MRISLLVLPSVVALMLSATVADNRPAVAHTIEDGFEHPNTLNIDQKIEKHRVIKITNLKRSTF